MPNMVLLERLQPQYSAHCIDQHVGHAFLLWISWSCAVLFVLAVIDTPFILQLQLLRIVRGLDQCVGTLQLPADADPSIPYGDEVELASVLGLPAPTKELIILLRQQ